MRNLKRVLSLALALVMVLGMMVITTSAATYTDADEITNKEAVEVLTAIGMVGGDNGAFNPNGTFTREAAAKLITYMMIGGKTAEKLAGTDVFSDVAANRWSAKYIAYCANLGYITGVGDGKFNPSGVLKDIELGKLVLCALGYDASKYTGANWASAVTVDLLDAGLVTEVTGEVISREDACAMILAAMTWTDGSDIYTVYNDANTNGIVDAGETIKVYAEAVDAYFAASAMVSAMPNVKVDVDTSDDYLLNTVYGVVADTIPDDFGRPGTSYALNDDAGTVLKYAKKPAATFNTTVSEKDFFKALGATGVAGTGKRYITVTNTTEDGQQVDHWASAADNSQAYACPGTNMQIDNNSNFPVPGTGEGITVEVYKTRVANQYTMVAIRQHMGVVTAVTEANAVAGTDRTVTIRVPGYVVNTFKTESFEKGDDVLVTMADGVIKSAVAPATLQGKVTKITNGSVFTIGEKEVKLSQMNTCGAPSLNDEHTWYVDAQGNLIAIATPGRATTYYGYLLDYEYDDYDSANLLGTGAAVAAEKVKFVNSDGEVVVLDTAFTTNPQTGKVVKFMANNTGSAGSSVSGVNWATDEKDVLFSYTLTADGKIASIAAARAAAGNEYTVLKGNAKLPGSSLMMTDKTVFFYTDGRKTVVYTGYTNIPVSTTGDLTFTVSANGAMNALVLEVDSVDTNSQTQYVYFASPAKTEEITAKGTVVTYTNVYINGVKAEAGLKFASAQSIDAGDVFEFTTNNTTGMATLGSERIDGEPAGTEITSIQSTYIVAGSVVYTDKDTVYYEIDTVNNTIAVAEGLPALSLKDAYSVNLLYNDKGTAANAAADVVYFYVGA